MFKHFMKLEIIDMNCQCLWARFLIRPYDFIKISPKPLGIYVLLNFHFTYEQIETQKLK
jgi:hypothetical protein